jgi:hypothetical protein
MDISSLKKKEDRVLAEKAPPPLAREVGSVFNDWLFRNQRELQMT